MSILTPLPKVAAKCGKHNTVWQRTFILPSPCACTVMTVYSRRSSKALGKSDLDRLCVRGCHAELQTLFELGKCQHTGKVGY